MLCNRIIIGEQCATPVLQHRPGMLTGATGGKLVDHAAPSLRILRIRAVRLQITAPICPDIRLMRFSRAGLKQLDWGFIGMDHRVLFQVLLHRCDQWHELRRTLTHPAGHARSGNKCSAAPVNLFLAKQWQMIVMFGDDDLRQQASSGDAFVDDLRGHIGCQHGLASRAAVFAANVAMHKELGGHAI